MMQYSVITKTGREVRAHWTGTRIELAVFGARWSDVQVEWADTLTYAVHRFNWLIEHNGGKVEESTQIPVLKSKETKYPKYDVIEKRYIDWDTHAKWFEEWTIKGWGSFNLDLTQPVNLHWGVKYPDCNGEDCVYADIGNALVFVPIRIVTVEIEIVPLNDY